MEINYTLVRYKTELGTEIGIIIGNTIIDVLGNIVIDYYDLQPLDYLVAGNRHSDAGIPIMYLLGEAWQMYLDWVNSRTTIPNIYRN